MPFLRVFKSNSNISASTSPHTPSQSALLHRLPDYTEASEPIKPTDTPQWAWTNGQCKEWLFAVCYETLGLSGEEAKTISDKFDGFGPVIYCMGRKDWMKLLGTSNRANSVYAMVLNLAREPGAVPHGLTIKHPREKKSKRGKGDEGRRTWLKRIWG
ncbi:hypothetical protein L207DRAFT_593254 [Hyaloscypha variabilis F]|uniref:Uncharacterized protein n=1 Tax=Hyaloscypha variabilis (strain UAMH 11265 / GT02V1 / F) TaxID=1149755 RepID=A0A2J6QTV3_HYAVF|nr:hypothetical protein L207DRAFT_593254 [Hyaloscypha variabilis F]